MAPEPSTPEQTRAQCAAMHARVMAQFDDIDAQIARIRAQMVADGLIREPTERTRLGEAAWSEQQAALARVGGAK